MNSARKSTEEKKEDQLTISIPDREFQIEEEEDEPFSGTYTCYSEPEDNELSDDDEYKVLPSEVLSLAMEEGSDGIYKLRQLVKDFDQKKISLEDLREAFSFQCQSKDYKGTNAIWWLARNRFYSSSCKILLHNLLKRGIITSEQLSAQCQGDTLKGTNAVFFLACKYKEDGFPILNELMIQGLITKDQLSARCETYNYDFSKYENFNVFDIFIVNSISFSTLLDCERWPKSYDLRPVVTSDVITDRVCELVSDDKLTPEYVKDKARILALHMILVNSGRELLKDSLQQTKVRQIVQEFDNIVLNILMGILPSPIQDIVEIDGSRSDSIGLRRVAPKILKDIIVTKLLQVRYSDPRPVSFWKKLPILLPEYLNDIFKLKFFKSYIKNHLIPKAEKDLLIQCMDSFVNNTAKLVRSAILELPGGWGILRNESMEYFKEVMRQSLQNYFSKYPSSVIKRDMQKKITAHIMAAITTEITSNKGKFNCTFVEELVGKIVGFPKGPLPESKSDKFFKPNREEKTFKDIDNSQPKTDENGIRWWGF